MKLETGPTATIMHIRSDLGVNDHDHAVWQTTLAVPITTYWSGESAPAGRHCSVSLLWSDHALYVRFVAMQAEPPIVSERPDISKKTPGLWDRDVCEVFIAPDPSAPRKYFEFEVAPTGEWLDLAIDSSSGERVTDWNYRSGLETFAVIDEMIITMVLKIPLSGIGLSPESGMKCRGNLFRCVGSGETRGYLNWRPTFTALPNFHVPERFGEFVFG